MKKVPLQLNADPRLARAIYSLAERDQVSVAAVLRESAERYIAERESEVDPLDGLVGISPRWNQLCAQARRIGSDDRVLLVGESGSGRVAVATAIASGRPVRVLDARHAEAVGMVDVTQVSAGAVAFRRP